MHERSWSIPPAIVVPVLLPWLGLFTSSASAQGPRQNPARVEQVPQLIAPQSVFRLLPDDPELVFEGKALPSKPDLLPPEAYESGPLLIPDEETESGQKILQISQQPLEDNAARDIDPEGHYETPRWNPLPQFPGSGSDESSGLSFKERSLTTTGIPGFDDGLGFTTLDFRGTVYHKDLPVFQVTPRFAWNFVDSNGTGLPAELYDLSLDATLYVPINDRWTAMIGVGPGLYTDMENLSSDALRVTGRGLGFYKWSETAKWTLGVIYLGRDDLMILPAAGLILTPNAESRIELMFPRPRLARRIKQDGNCEHWCYLAGELGGGQWAIERSGGIEDSVNYNDYRLIAGYEFTRGDVYRWLVEAGYVFGREIEFVTGPGSRSVPSSGMLRGGFAF